MTVWNLVTTLKRGQYQKRLGQAPIPRAPVFNRELEDEPLTALPQIPPTVPFGFLHNLRDCIKQMRHSAGFIQLPRRNLLSFGRSKTTIEEPDNRNRVEAVDINVDTSAASITDISLSTESSRNNASGYDLNLIVPQPSARSIPHTVNFRQSGGLNFVGRRGLNIAEVLAEHETASIGHLTTTDASIAANSDDSVFRDADADNDSIATTLINEPLENYATSSVDNWSHSSSLQLPLPSLPPPPPQRPLTPPVSARPRWSTESRQSGTTVFDASEESE